MFPSSAGVLVDRKWSTTRTASARRNVCPNPPMWIESVRRSNTTASSYLSSPAQSGRAWLLDRYFCAAAFRRTHRQADVHGRASPALTGRDRDLSTVRLHQSLHECQSKPQPVATPAVTLPERLKHSLTLLRGDAFPIV